MSRQRSSQTGPSAQLVDAVMESYVSWREQNMAVETAYANWTRAAASERQDTFAAYLAALDREEHAAAAYERILAQASATHR
jgi:hypothetical protein